MTATDTLILLTREEAGPLAAFVPPLVTKIAEAAVREAGDHASERLPVPLIMGLDECGNVVTLPDLPEWYTHFRSKGIINAYFQSPAQGEAAYSRERFEQLWDAAGARVYDGGIDNERWLRSLSDLIGTYEKMNVSTTTNQGMRSYSESSQERARVSVAGLANLPEWRAIVRTSDGGVGNSRDGDGVQRSGICGRDPGRRSDRGPGVSGDDLPDDVIDDVSEETGDEEPVPHLPPGPAPEVVDWVDKLTAHLESPDRRESLWCPQWQDRPRL